MIAQYIWILGSSIFTVLGSIHLYYTFFTNKFSSRNAKVVDEMKSSFPNLTKETSIWKAWIGFNASHSSGAIFIGVMNIYVMVNYYSIAQNDIFYFAFNIVTVLFYLWLASKYWFKIPFVGILCTLICYLASFTLALFF